MTALNYYHVLGVAEQASQDDIDAAYQTRSERLLTYSGEDSPLLGYVREAHQILRDPETRANYDRALGTRPISPAGTPARSDSPAGDSDGTGELIAYFRREKEKAENIQLGCAMAWLVIFACVGIFLLVLFDSSR